MKRVLTSCVISISLLIAGGAALQAETKPQSPEQCPAPPPKAEEKACHPTNEDMQAFQPKGGLAWMTEAAEFKALAEAIFAAAGHRLEEISREHKSEAPPWVVVVDADDTILDNMRFQLEGAACGVGFSYSRWHKWVARREAGAVPGAAGFLARVSVLGGKVAVITNRSAKNMKATAENMRKLGIDTDPERVCFLGRPDCVNTPPYGNDKDERRAALRLGQAVACWKDQDAAVAKSWAQPQDIVMYIGDNVQDFPGMTQAAAAAHPEAVAEHLGHDWFLIPNAEYGSWEKKHKSWIKRIVSDQVTGWANLSGLAADPDDSDVLYAVSDKDAGARILTIDVSKSVPEIVHAVELTCGTNLDLEGIAAKKDGSGFWVVSEGDQGKDTKPEDNRINLLLEVDKNGNCLRKEPLPVKEQTRFEKRGFEGVTLDENGKVYVAIQSPLKDKDDPTKNEDETLIARFDPAATQDDKIWRYYRYKLDEAKAGVEVGINEILYLGKQRFAVIERDNKRGCDAKIKRIHTFTLPREDRSDQLIKDEGIDLIKFFERHNVSVSEQIEGLAITPDDDVFVVTDDNAEDTRLLYLGNAKDKDLKLTPEAKP